MSSSPEESSVSLLDYLYVWLKWRRFIVGTTGTSAVLAVAVSLIITPTYLATTTVLPPKPETPVSGGGTGLSSFAATLDLIGLGKDDEVDTYLVILESRRVREATIRVFDLQRYYEKETVDETLKSLDADLDIEVTKEKTLILSMIHEDSIRAAQIANFMIDELDRINKTLVNEQARNNRLFIERRLGETREQLAASEEALKDYQEEHRTLGLSEENRAALMAGAQLEASVMSMEVQAEALRKMLGPTHPYVAQMIGQIDVGKRRLSELPTVGLELARLFREVEIQTRLLAFLLPQYEQARIQEARDTPTVQIIDRAVPPNANTLPNGCLSSGAPV